MKIKQLNFVQKNLISSFLLLSVLTFWNLEKVHATLSVSIAGATATGGSLPVIVTHSDPLYTQITQTTPQMIQDAFQDMKSYLGLNILKYTEQQSHLDAVLPPDASPSKSNGALMSLNQTFMTYWQTLFGSVELVRTLFQPAGSDENSIMVARHLANYCSNEEASHGVCTPASTDNQNNYIGAADLSFSSIIGYTSYPSSAIPINGPTPQQAAAIDFINNVMNPTPVVLPTNVFQTSMVNTTNARGQAASFLPTSSSGDAPLAALYKSTALASIGQTLLLNMVAERTQIPGLGTEMGISGTTDISLWGALQYEATRRFQTEEWHNGINSSPPTAILREIANMGAMQLAMQFRQIQQNEEIKALLAAQVGYAAQSAAAAATASQSQSTSPSVTQ